MLTARDVTKHRDGRLVLDSVSLSVGPGHRVGVVGPNGIGKSTFLRILAGIDEPEGGRVERVPSSLTVGYLPQEPDARPDETLLDYLARRTGVREAEAELDRLTVALDRDPSCVGAYSSALEHFVALGGDDLGSRAAAVCADLGLPADRLQLEVGASSGGEAARAALAAILLTRFDVLLLDEPTNNLDFAGLDRLEQLVSERRGGLVVVSHDRAFLDDCVDRVLELAEGTHRGTEYAGGWSEYVAARELARSQQYAAFARYRAERSRLLERARTQRRWSERGVRKLRLGGETDKYVRHRKTQSSEKQAAKIKITERRLARLPPVGKPWEGWRLRLSLAPSARAGDVVARLDGAVVERGAFRLGPVDLELGWRDRLVVLGPNGSGKSTLLGALLGRFPLVAGRRWLGPGVVVGEMDQPRGRFDGAEPLLATVLHEAGLPADEARSLLAKFGLGAAYVERPGRLLSPGERTRALLAVLMARGVNCLVLDEPTNHLDVEAIEQLETALAGFDGTLVLVTHDRRLLESVELTRTLELG